MDTFHTYQPARRRALLAGEAERRSNDRRHHLVEVRIAVDHDRVLAAQLGDDPCDGPAPVVTSRGLGHDPQADSRDPVKAIRSTRGSDRAALRPRARAREKRRARLLGARLRRAGHELAAIAGVCSAGLSTTALPATRAAHVMPVGIALGKFQGEMTAQTPRVRGRAIGSPRRAVTAPLHRWRAEHPSRVVLAEVDGFADVCVGFRPPLPASRHLESCQLVSSPAHAVGRPEEHRRAVFDPDTRLHLSAARVAISMASSTWAGPHAVASATTEPGSDGSTDRNVLPVCEPLAPDDRLDPSDWTGELCGYGGRKIRSLLVCATPRAVRACTQSG